MRASPDATRQCEPKSIVLTGDDDKTSVEHSRARTYRLKNPRYNPRGRYSRQYPERIKPEVFRGCANRLAEEGGQLGEVDCHSARSGLLSGN